MDWSSAVLALVRSSPRHPRGQTDSLQVGEGLLRRSQHFHSGFASRSSANESGGKPKPSLPLITRTSAGSNYSRSDPSRCESHIQKGCRWQALSVPLPVPGMLSKLAPRGPWRSAGSFSSSCRTIFNLNATARMGEFPVRTARLPGVGAATAQSAGFEKNWQM